MTRIIQAIFLLFVSLSSIAQQSKVQVRVTETEKEKSLPATVTLCKFVDTTSIKQIALAKDSSAIFMVDTTERYWIKVSSVGFATVLKLISPKANGLRLNIELNKKIKNNEDVVVTGKKPLIRQEDDKTIIDPENLVQSSTNAFEVLEKTPGVFADQDGNFYLTSTTPATVQINGRDLRLSAADMASLIKSLPPNAILRIEIVKTPSAKNDANSSGGVVNIVLRKGVKLGLAGSAFTGMQQGRYGNQFIGASLSNSDDKKSLYASTGLNFRSNFDELNSVRYFKIDTGLQQSSFNRTNGWNPYLNFGASFMPNKRWDFSYDANFSVNFSNNNYTNTNDIAKVSTQQIFTKNNNNTLNDGHTINLIQSISSKYKAADEKIEWTSSISHSFFNNNNDQDYNILKQLPAGAPTVGGGEQSANRNLFTIQSDVIYKPIKKFTIEFGAKNSNIAYNNEANFTLNNAVDIYRTNKFKYKENIAATYIQAAKTVEKIVFKGGVRLENTFMEGTQLVPSLTNFSIKRTDLFPYGFISRPVFKIMGYDLKAFLVYNRSISRPGYDLLNPFRRFVDNYLTEVGNPNLQPQFTEKFEANISFDERPIFAFGQNRIKGIFTNVIYQNPANPAEALRTYDNLGSNTENYFQFVAALPPGGKYFVVVGGTRNFNTYDGQYEGKPLKFSNKSWNFFTYHQLKLDKRSTLSLQGWMQTGGLFQFYQLSDFGQINMSVNRQFFKRKLTVTLNVRDMFFTNNNSFVIMQGSVNASGSRVSDTRRFGLNLRYNFGIKKKKEDGDFNTEAQNRN